MNIKILTTEETTYAVELAKIVYENTVRYKQADLSYNRYFDEYMKEDIIKKQVEEKQLTIWGVCENGQLLAVSGMTSTGHITMLYVHPAYVCRKYGALLIEEMRRYAASEYDLDWVTVNAMPTWSATYFQKRGFRVTDESMNYSSPYIPLRTRSNRELVYKTRPVSGGTLAIVISIFICLFVGSSFGYMLYFLLAR